MHQPGAEPDGHAARLHALAGAHMEFMEDRKGMLKEGYLADIAVLNADMERLKPVEIGGVKPVLTICDGRVVFEEQ
ncbi:MAG: amidohydrolase family protein [Hyphomicrobiales bacterium]